MIFFNFILYSFLIMTNPVTRNTTKFTSMLEENLGSSLCRVDANAVVCQDCRRVPVNLEFLGDVFENSRERSLSRNVYSNNKQI